jgi:hypothetical protein
LFSLSVFICFLYVWKMYGQMSPLSPLVCFLTRTQQLKKILRFREATLSQIILEKLANKSVNTVKVEREFLSHNLCRAFCVEYIYSRPIYNHAILCDYMVLITYINDSNSICLQKPLSRPEMTQK